MDWKDLLETVAKYTKVGFYWRATPQTLLDRIPGLGDFEWYGLTVGRIGLGLVVKREKK